MVYSISGVNEKVVSDSRSSLWEGLLAFGDSALLFVYFGIVKACRSLTSTLSLVAASLPFLTLGIQTALGDIDNGFIFSSSSMVWHRTAMLVGAAVSAPVFAIVSQKFGRKVGYFFISVAQGLVFIPVFVNTINSYPYFYALLGISSGGIFSVLLPYIREITLSAIRGFSLTLSTVLVVGGYQLRVLLEWYDPLTFMGLALVGVQLLMGLCLVESPSYLVIVGKNEGAKEAIARLKRLPLEDPNIVKEINTIQGEVTLTDDRSTLQSLYRNEITWDSLKMSILLFTSMELCGSLVFLDDRSTRVYFGVQTENITVALVLLGSLVTVAAVIFLDRKYILTFGLVAMAIFLGVYSVSTQIESPPDAVRLTGDVSIPIVLAAYGMACGLPAIVVVELFSSKICTPILAALLTFSQLLKLAHIHTFEHAKDYIGEHTMLYVFACINLYAGVYTLFVLPNFRNKSLRQIEKQVKRIPLPA